MRYSIVFFFSSRRRHTRCSRDWSSDVCSSDLEDVRHRLVDGKDVVRLRLEGDVLPTRGDRDAGAGGIVRRRADRGDTQMGRSEERRVGKGVDLGGGRIVKKEKIRVDSWRRDEE